MVRKPDGYCGFGVCNRQYFIFSNIVCEVVVYWLRTDNTIVVLVVVYVRTNFYDSMCHGGDGCGKHLKREIQWLFCLWCMSVTGCIPQYGMAGIVVERLWTKEQDYYFGCGICKWQFLLPNASWRGWLRKSRGQKTRWLFWLWCYVRNIFIYEYGMAEKWLWRKYTQKARWLCWLWCMFNFEYGMVGMVVVWLCTENLVFILVVVYFKFIVQGMAGMVVKKLWTKNRMVILIVGMYGTIFICQYRIAGLIVERLLTVYPMVVCNDSLYSPICHGGDVCGRVYVKNLMVIIIVMYVISICISQ